MGDELRDAIEEAAQEPVEVESDGTRARARNLKEQIEADKYLSGSDAVAKKQRGLRFTRLIPPGTA